MSELGHNRYGKDGIRLVLVRRPAGDEAAHELRDLTVDVRLSGDFAAVHTAGDNAPVLPTDTMRSTVYALAQPHLTGTIEAFGQALAARFLVAAPAATEAEVSLREHAWQRAGGPDGDHPHTFVAGSAEQQTAVVTARRGGEVEVRSGLTGLTVLRTRGSAFSGFLRDEFTVLAETRDRIMASDVSAEWAVATPAAPDPVRAGVRAALLAAFAGHDSESVQHTLYAMADAVLAAEPAVPWIRLRMPNKHHVPVDLAPFGLTNDRAVYVVTDRPYGVIEAEVSRA